MQNEGNYSHGFCFIPPDISPRVKHVICILRYYESHDVFENVEI